MSQVDLISVVMPVFNGENYLKEAIDSILNQSYTHFEFIIINDGSTDKTASILKQIKDDRLKIIHFENNQGLIPALNRGFQEAKGAFIARMDADDVALPQRLKLQVAAMQQHPEWIACDSDYYLFDRKSKTRSTSNFSSEELKLVLVFTTCFCHPSVMIRNNRVDNLLRYESDFKHVEDYRLWTKLTAQGELGHLPVPLLLYRQHPSQVSNLQRTQQLQGSKRIREDYLASMGIHLDEATLHSLHKVGNNEFIRSEGDLIAIEKSLVELQKTLLNNTSLPPTAIRKVVQKFWYDSCGYTNLGYVAYSAYKKSSLSEGQRQPLLMLRLALKCLIRSRK
jgi:glycosyltransferase involved in cell wall biosynthesis